jgi:hypothetical protein
MRKPLSTILATLLFVLPAHAAKNGKNTRPHKKPAAMVKPKPKVTPSPVAQPLPQPTPPVRQKMTKQSIR